MMSDHVRTFMDEIPLSLCFGKNRFVCCILENVVIVYLNNFCIQVCLEVCLAGKMTIINL